MKPLWKSYYEFRRLFGQSISTSIQRIKHCLNPIFGDEENYLIIEQFENKQVIEYRSLFVLMQDDDLCAYGDLFDTTKKAPNKFFYLFIKKTVSIESRKCAIQTLKDILK